MMNLKSVMCAFALLTISLISPALQAADEAPTAAAQDRRRLGEELMLVCNQLYLGGTPELQERYNLLLDRYQAPLHTAIAQARSILARSSPQREPELLALAEEESNIFTKEALSILWLEQKHGRQSESKKAIALDLRGTPPGQEQIAVDMILCLFPECDELTIVCDHRFRPVMASKNLHLVLTTISPIPPEYGRTWAEDHPLAWSFFRQLQENCSIQ